MDNLDGNFGPKSPPKRTKTGVLHTLYTLRKNGQLTLGLLALFSIYLGINCAQYSGLTLDLCLSDHEEEEAVCSTIVFSMLTTTVIALLPVLLAGATVQGLGSQRMEGIAQSIGGGLVAGYAYGFTKGREQCIAAIERGGSVSCLTWLRIGTWGSLAAMLGLLIMDQVWVKEDAKGKVITEDRGALPGAR